MAIPESSLVNRKQGIFNQYHKYIKTLPEIQSYMNYFDYLMKDHQKLNRDQKYHIGVSLGLIEQRLKKVQELDKDVIGIKVTLNNYIRSGRNVTRGERTETKEASTN